VTVSLPPGFFDPLRPLDWGRAVIPEDQPLAVSRLWPNHGAVPVCDVPRPEEIQCIFDGSAAEASIFFRAMNSGSGPVHNRKATSGFGLVKATLGRRLVPRHLAASRKTFDRYTRTGFLTFDTTAHPFTCRNRTTANALAFLVGTFVYRQVH